jgi:hypothetical protein
MTAFLTVDVLRAHAVALTVRDTHLHISAPGPKLTARWIFAPGGHLACRWQADAPAPDDPLP